MSPTTALGALTGQIRHLPGVREAAVRGVYQLDPDQTEGQVSGGPDSSDAGSVGFDQRVNTWFMPNIMASVNAPVVRKSAKLLGYYGKEGGVPSYSEVAASKSRWQALVSTCGLAVGGLCLAIPPLRALLFHLKILPIPGEGPDKTLRDSGYFHTWVLGVGKEADDATSDAKDAGEPPMVVADVRSGTAGDHGYKGTAQMAIEAALCLALARDRCDASGGVLTPAVGLGDVLVDRLENSGMELDVRVLGSSTELKTPSRKRTTPAQFVG